LVLAAGRSCTSTPRRPKPPTGHPTYTWEQDLYEQTSPPYLSRTIDRRLPGTPPGTEGVNGIGSEETYDPTNNTIYDPATPKAPPGTRTLTPAQQARLFEPYMSQYIRHLRAKLASGAARVDGWATVDGRAAIKIKFAHSNETDYVAADGSDVPIKTIQGSPSSAYGRLINVYHTFKYLPAAGNAGLLSLTAQHPSARLDRSLRDFRAADSGCSRTDDAARSSVPSLSGSGARARRLRHRRAAGRQRLEPRFATPDRAVDLCRSGPHPRVPSGDAAAAQVLQDPRVDLTSASGEMSGGVRDELLDRVRRVWAALAGVPAGSFACGAARVMVSPGSKICPSGWVGVVELGGAVVMTVRSERAAERLRVALASRPDETIDLATHLSQKITVAEVLGPAALYYPPSDVRVPLAADRVESMRLENVDVQRLLGSVEEDDARESGLASVSSRAFVARVDGLVVCAAGYRHWPHDVAHLSVLTAPSVRGQGLASRTAGAAVADALDHGLLPQWRARPNASRRVAEHLAFRHLGWQMSLRPASEPETAT
jgi:GNAT superfamily N-acetyltransferase